MNCRKLLVLAAMSVLLGCGSNQEPTELLDDSDRSASITIFSRDSSGNFSWGKPSRRETIIELGSGGRSTRGSSDSDNGGSSWSRKNEKPDNEEARGSHDQRDCFVREAARERLGDTDELPQIRATTTYEIRQERYRTRREAEQAFDRQLASAKERMTAAWQANKSGIDTLRASMKVAATTHNKDVLRTLSFAEDIASAGADLVRDFKTSPLSTHGANLRKAAKDISNGFKTLDKRFTGKDLEERGKVLKKAGNILKVADALFSDGDADSGEYMLNVALTMLDVGLSYMPMVSWAKDIVEAATGYSIIYQRPLSTAERASAIVGAVTAGIGSKVLTTHKALSAWKKVFLTSNSGQNAMAALARAAQSL